MSICPDCEPVEDIVFFRGTKTTNEMLADALDVLDETNPMADVVIRRGISCLDIPADAVMILFDEDYNVVMSPNAEAKS